MISPPRPAYNTHSAQPCPAHSTSCTSSNEHYTSNMSYLYDYLDPSALLDSPARVFASLSRSARFDSIAGSVLRMLIIGALAAGVRRLYNYLSTHIERSECALEEMPSQCHRQLSMTAPDGSPVPHGVHPPHGPRVPVDPHLARDGPSGPGPDPRLPAVHRGVA